ncbi:hypothetical protein Ocin01_17747 [Orchesella cincta]|uniref:Uncharacterized protein n=1 Tax=Orchesella cincta TaxID=48709 RepID=A0A1D2M7J1_ORCCI|nr:hypothetical protein Ocin01_17747 [Orchesella cincta]
MSVETNESSNSRMEAVTETNSAVPNQGRPNPMMNCLVLQTLFEHSSITELKTYRQVCRLWWEESLAQWRREVWVKLGDDEYMARGLEDYPDEILGNSSADPLQFGKHPYRKYKLSKLKLGLVGDRQLEFWRKCGPKITHLKISKSCFHSVRQFEALLNQFVPNLEFLHLKKNMAPMDGLPEDESNLMDAPPQLKSKVFKELHLETQLFFINHPRLSVDWFWLLGQFPRIKSVSIANYDFVYSHRSYFPVVELDQILNAMITIKAEQGISWKLEKLDLLFMGGIQRPVFQNIHADLFRQLQLPLTTLCLHIGPATTKKSLKTLLESCAFTLRKLVVYRDDFTVNLEEDDELTMDFPYGDIGNSLGEDAAGSHFSGFQTFLQLSNMLAEQEDNREGHFRGNFRSVVEDTTSPPGECTLTRLMPNLKTLMIGLENDGFRVVCAGWKQLEVLIIQPYEVNQTGLTGSIPLIKHRLPNLSDLTGLRYFGMGFETSSSKMALTDESVLDAIFPLKNLQRITGYYNLEKMSEEVYDQLRSRFPNNWIFDKEAYDSEWLYELYANQSSDSDVEDEVELKESTFKRGVGINLEETIKELRRIRVAEREQMDLKHSTLLRENMTIQMKLDKLNERFERLKKKQIQAVAVGAEKLERSHQRRKPAAVNPVPVVPTGLVQLESNGREQDHQFESQATVEVYRSVVGWTDVGHPGTWKKGAQVKIPFISFEKERMDDKDYVKQRIEQIVGSGTDHL